MMRGCGMPGDGGIHCGEGDVRCPDCKGANRKELDDIVGSICDGRISEGAAKDVITEILFAASRYWEGFEPEDFCLQGIFPDRVIFGSTNRLVWTPGRGFQALASHCNTPFLENARKMGPLPERSDNGPTVPASC
jgi:hypothetical protein